MQRLFCRSDDAAENGTETALLGSLADSCEIGGSAAAARPLAVASSIRTTTTTLVASTSASPASAAASAGMASDDVVAVTMLIRAFQSHGHEVASLDPLGLLPTPEVEVLDPATYGFAETDWDRPLQLAAASANFGAAYDGLLGNPDLDGDGQTTMRELVTFLKGVYCGNIGSEYMHIAGLVRFFFILHFGPL